MTREDAMRKVGHLLKLAERPGTPEEGAAALAAANAIMEKYEIEREALNLSGEQQEPDEEMMSFLNTPGGQLDAVGKRWQYWRGTLAKGVANANGCFIFAGTRLKRDGDWTKTVEICGRPSSVETVRYLYAWISKEIVRLSEQAGRGMGPVWKREFCEGAAAAVAYVLKKEHERTKAEVRSGANNPNAMVLVNNAIARVENRLALAQQFAWDKHKLKRGESRGNFGFDPDAREEGAKAGLKINVRGGNKQIGGQAKQIRG